MSSTTNALVRPRHDRVIAGVCAGLARRFGVSPGLVRLLAVLSIILPGPQVLAYLVLWVIMPNER
ncbi:MAG: PspC domain-containing protein [Acidobacteria bacterium]|nr:MAG: PspC domain-containing protein [Acidobacteriota bacterium]